MRAPGTAGVMKYAETVTDGEAGRALREYSSPGCAVLWGTSFDPSRISILALNLVVLRIIMIHSMYGKIRKPIRTT